jgi:hypothetical protein
LRRKIVSSRMSMKPELFPKREYRFSNFPLRELSYLVALVAQRAADSNTAMEMYISEAMAIY